MHVIGLTFTQNPGDMHSKKNETGRLIASNKKSIFRSIVRLSCESAGEDARTTAGLESGAMVDS